MKTKIISLQFAFFFKDIVVRPDLEFSDLNSIMLNAFDGMPQIIPLPPQVPVEVPVMVLQSSKQNYVCQISRTRLDFMVNRIEEVKANSDLLKDFNAKVLGLTKYIVERQEVVRFGMVARYFHQDNTAVKTLRARFFTAAVDGSEELSLRYNKKSSAYGFDVNDILEISAADITFEGRSEKGIFIQRDINNSPLPGKALDLDTLSKISQKYSPRISESEIEGLIK